MNRRLLVLAGGGHSHALLLRRWWMRPQSRPSDTAVLLVSRGSTALYSGMVPGLVAGLYTREQASIDLRLLCSRAGVAFLQAEITGLDPFGRALQLDRRPPLRFDRLSLDVGAVTPAPSLAGEQPVKPLEPFLHWLEQRPEGQPLRIRGGGAAALELAFALRSRGWAVELLLRGRALQLGSVSANRRGLALLQRAGIPVHRAVPDTTPADLACTGSRAPAWLAAGGLPVDAASGRVLTEATLQVQGHPGLFACGDCGLIAASPRPPSGVWAVRAAPLLAENLRRSLGDPDRPLRSWRPQPLALQLLATAGAPRPRALARYGPFLIGPAAWIWRWKDRIDRRFMAGFAPTEAMAGTTGGADPMACRGCAAKLAAQPLTSALTRLDGSASRAEDAVAVGRSAEGSLLLQSVDGFPALLDDPWLNARLTTLHASSDLWASGADVRSVQALVTLPQAAPHLQEEWLLQTLAGVRSVLDPIGATLVGGHTLEGRDGAGLALALSVNGAAPLERHWPKGPLEPGLALLLSRPIGSGVLFAAAMAGAARPAWIDAALAVMQSDQSALVALLARHGIRACTDITGFGLLGHLGEMLGPGVVVELDGAAIPSHAGALELLEQGFARSLAPSNAAALALLAPDGPVRLAAPVSPAALQLLVDPQTCGPLLAALPEAEAAEALVDLRASGFPRAALIGRTAAGVLSRAPASPR
ncbi:MAG: selenide, water dikinase SelD [Cyanobium sp.]